MIEKIKRYVVIDRQIKFFNEKDEDVSDKKAYCDGDITIRGEVFDDFYIGDGIDLAGKLTIEFCEMKTQRFPKHLEPTVLFELDIRPYRNLIN